MSKSRHHHNLPRSSHDIEQRQQEQPLLLVDSGPGAGIGGGGAGNTCMMVDDDELKVVKTGGCLDRTASSTVVDGVPMTLSPTTAASCGSAAVAERSTGAVRRPSIRGLQSSSSAASSPTAWKLKYQDFMPVAQPNIGLWDKSEPFQKLVDRANEWLRHNGADVLVKTCETVTWMSPDARQLGDPEMMVLSKSIVEGSVTYYVSGLRLWLVPRPAQQAATGSSTNGRQAGKPSSTAGGQTTIYFNDFVPEAPDCTRIHDLVDRINKKLSQRQVKGRILSVETVAVPAGIVPTTASSSGHGKSSPFSSTSGGASGGAGLGGGTNTMPLPFPGHPQVFNSQVTRWSESVDVDWPRAFVLRLFSVRDPVSSGHIQPTIGTPAGRTGRQNRNRRYQHHALHQVYGSDKVVVGIKDVVPRPAADGFYEGFEILIDRTNTWLKDQHDICIANMQSILVQKIEGCPHMDMGSTCFHTMPGLNNDEPAEFFRILRVAYIRPIGDVLAIDVPVIYPFTYESFMPELVRHKEHHHHMQQQQPQPPTTASGAMVSTTVTSLSATVNGGSRERMERMKETFAKVIAFLRNSGSDVICSETVINPVQMYPDDHVDSQSTDSHDDDEMRFIFTVRLFLTGQIGQQGDGGAQQLIKRASLTAAGPTETDLTNPSGVDGSGIGKPGNGARHAPLFLRHVVGRQFKYRWLALAASAFTCMTIIVTLSVVYSNR